MKAKKVPLRQCIACRAQKPKRELIRIVRNPDGVLLYDSRGKVSGRGAYLCASPACLQRAIKNKLFSRQLNAEPERELLTQLEYLLGNDEHQV